MRRLGAGVYFRVQWVCASEAILGAVERGISRAGDLKRMWARDIPAEVVIYGRPHQ